MSDQCPHHPTAYMGLGYCMICNLDPRPYPVVEGTGVEPGEWSIPEDLDTSALTSFSMDVQFLTPDPEVLSLMTGDWTRQAHTGHSIYVTMQVPARRRAWRVVWEWLARKPRQYNEHVFYAPHAEVSRNPDGSITFYPAPQDWGCGPFHPPESE